jgi:hypothetical protein
MLDGIAMSEHDAAGRATHQMEWVAFITTEIDATAQRARAWRTYRTLVLMS